MMVLNFALPVYVAETIDLPGWVVGAIFTLNTALVGLGQGLVVRRMTGRVRAQMMGLAQLIFVVAYALFVVAGWLPVWVAIVVMLVGAAIYTGGELTGGPVFSATAAEAAPDHLRGRYLGLFQLSWGLGGAVTPVAFTWLLAHGQTTLWWVLALVALASAAYLQRLPQVLPAAGRRVPTASRRKPRPTPPEGGGARQHRGSRGVSYAARVAAHDASGAAEHAMGRHLWRAGERGRSGLADVGEQVGEPRPARRRTPCRPAIRSNSIARSSSPRSSSWPTTPGVAAQRAPRPRARPSGGSARGRPRWRAAEREK